MVFDLQRYQDFLATHSKTKETVYNFPSPSPSLLAFAPFVKLEQIASCSADLSVLLSLPVTEVRGMSPQQRQDTANAIRNKHISCSVEGCIMSTSTKQADGSDFKVGLCDGASWSPYSPGVADRGLCQMHQEWALVSQACVPSHRDHSREACKVTSLRLHVGRARPRMNSSPKSDSPTRRSRRRQA